MLGDAWAWDMENLEDGKDNSDNRAGRGQVITNIAFSVSTQAPILLPSVMYLNMTLNMPKKNGRPLAMFSAHNTPQLSNPSSVPLPNDDVLVEQARIMVSK